MRKTRQPVSDIGPDRFLTSHQVGSLLQVNPSSVNKWVKEGRLQAFRTPGGHRRFRASDVIAFLEEYDMPVPPLLHGARKRRLMAVDDDEKQLTALRRLVNAKAPHIEVMTVNSGVAALMQMGVFKPDIVLIDVIMPNFDGLEVARQLRQLPELQSTKVIVTSANLTPKMERDAAEAGAFMVAPKPVELDIILAAFEMDAALEQV